MQRNTHHTESTKAKMRLAKLGKPSYTRTAEIKAKVSATLKASWTTRKTKARRVA